MNRNLMILGLLWTALSCCSKAPEPEIGRDDTVDVRVDSVQLMYGVKRNGQGYGMFHVRDPLGKVAATYFFDKNSEGTLLIEVKKFQTNGRIFEVSNYVGDTLVYQFVFPPRDTSKYGIAMLSNEYCVSCHSTIAARPNDYACSDSLADLIVKVGTEEELPPWAQKITNKDPLFISTHGFEIFSKDELSLMIEYLNDIDATIRDE